MIFHQTLEAFNVQKTHTTAYHPQGDGMVECFNRSLLQMFRSYVENQEDWEKFFPCSFIRGVRRCFLVGGLMYVC